MASEKVMMGLDIGSGWIRAVVGSLSRDGQLMIDSLCERPSEGVRNGVIVNFEQTCDAIRSVIHEAELQAGVQAQTAVAGVGGQAVRCRQSEGVAGITTKGLEITNSDIFRSLEVARTFSLPPDRTIIHTLVQDFTVDGRSGIKDPHDMTGHRLESRALVVTASSMNSANTRKCIVKAGIANPRIISSVLADAEIVLSQDEKEMGTILVNIGSNCTNMIAYINGSPAYVGGIDFGSSNVTNDIACVLNKPRQVAEQLKCDCGCCFTPDVGNQENVYIPQVSGLPVIEMPKKELCKIIEPRMAEIFSFLCNELEENNICGPFGGGIVLVGGGSLLSGAADLASEIFKVQARIGFPEALPGLDRSYISPQYTTVLGLLKSEAKKYSSTSGTKGKKNRSSSGKNGFFHKVGNFFKTVV